MAKADELGFNALIKPILEENQVDDGDNDNINKEQDSQSDINIDNQIDNKEDIQSDIPKDNKQDISKDKKHNKKKIDNKSNKTNTQKDNKKNIQKDNGRDTSKDISKSPMDILLASKRKKIEKRFVGLHLPVDVDEALTQFKKDNDIDKSETVTIAIRLFLKDYFDLEEDSVV